jgi:hypothetical protein
MFQHVTLKRRWPPHNLALVLCFNMWLQKHFCLLTCWHDPLFSEELRNISHHVRSKPQVFFFLIANLYITNFFWTNVKYIAIDQRFLRQILLLPCISLIPTLPCFSFVFKRDPKEFDMTYYIHSKQRVFRPSLWFCHMPIPSEFGIKPLFAPRCK